MTDYSRKSSNFADKKSATSSSQGIENTNSLLLLRASVAQQKCACTADKKLKLNIYGNTSNKYSCVDR